MEPQTHHAIDVLSTLRTIAVRSSLNASSIALHCASEKRFASTVMVTVTRSL